MHNVNKLAATVVLISLSPMTFINYVSAATVVGNTKTYENETFTTRINETTGAPTDPNYVNNLILKNTQINLINPSLPGWPSALSLGGVNGSLGNNSLYGNVTVSIDKESAISIDGNVDRMSGIYNRTDSANSVTTVNSAATITITNSQNTAAAANGIFAENLVSSTNPDTGAVHVNLQDGSNINITTGGQIQGVFVAGPSAIINTDSNSEIVLTNSATTSTANTIGLNINGKQTTNSIENNGKITINGGKSTGNNYGINSTAGTNSAITNTGDISVAGNNGIAINTSAKTNQLTSSGDILVTGNNANGIVVNSTDTTATAEQTLKIAGNITINGTNNGTPSTVHSAIRLNNQTQGTGVITYDDANGKVSVTGTSTGQSPSNNASGFYLYSDKGADALIDIKNINEIKIESPNSMGISAYSKGGTGNTQINFANGLLTTLGSNADGISVTNQNNGGDILINQGGDISAVSTTNVANASPTEGVYATKDNTKGNVVINSTGNIEVEAQNATGAGANNLADGSATFNFDNTNKHIDVKGSAYSTTGNQIKGVSINAANTNNSANINITKADYINASSENSDATGLSATASAGANSNINIGHINTITAESTNANAVAITSTVTGTGTSTINLADDVGSVTAIGNGQAISSTTTTGTNSITLGKTNIIGGMGANGGGVYMASTTGQQQLLSSANINATNDQAIFGSSSASTTVNNNGTITGYTNFTGTGAVTFNNNANVVLQNFQGLDSKATIINNFGTDGQYNNAGTIKFADANFDGTATNAVFNVATFTNSGTIDLTGKNPTGANNLVGDTFTINGNYVSNGGSIYLNTLLDDASSNGGQGTSDLVTVNGNVTTGTGATKLYITPTASTANLGGLTTGNGIKVIDVQSTSTTDAFQLGRPVVAGAYEYTLGQGQTDDSWYLSSYYKGNSGTNGIIQYNPAMGAYLANQTAAVQMFQQTLFDRLISSSDGKNNDASKNLFWMRTKMTHGSYDSIHSGLSNRTRSYTLQMGGDLNVWALNNGGYFHLGVMGGYGDFKDTSKSDSTGTKTDGKVKGYTAGVYGTYFDNQDTNLGLYVDLWSQMGWYRNEISGEAQIGTKKYNSTVWSNSVELGYGIPLAVSGEYQWLATPQAQLTYNSYDVDNQHDRNNLNITNNNASGLDTRLGIHFHARGVQKDLIEPFLEVNWLDTTAKNKLNFNGKSYKDGFAKDRFEAKVGLQGNITKQWSVSAQVGGQWGNNSYNNYQGQLNVNYKF